jgi:preprotein translocase subunit YajC
MTTGMAVLAQVAPAGGGISTLVFMGLLFAVMYFVMIRPQQKQLREHRNLLAALKKGDDVVTQGGVLGKIYAITDKVVTLEIANGVRIRVLKSSIQAKGGVDEGAVVAGSSLKVEDKKSEEK